MRRQEDRRASSARTTEPMHSEPWGQEYGSASDEQEITQPLKMFQAHSVCSNGKQRVNGEFRINSESVTGELKSGPSPCSVFQSALLKRL